MRVDAQLLSEVRDRFEHAVLVFLDPEGYPMSVATAYSVDLQRGVVELDRPAGTLPAPGTEVNVIFSHIRPQPEMGYDERRYVQLWGRLDEAGDRLRLAPERAHSWDEQKVPFFQYSELTVPQAHRYMEELSERQGRKVRPRLSFGWLALRTTRAPFLSATIVPVLLGIAVAALQGSWDLWLALLTVLAASFIHLALNVANDVFDTMSGADAANTTPTKFSGGSRVAHYGLVSLKGLALLSAGLYAAGIGIGLYLALVTDFWPLFWLGVAGVAISVFYTAPPFRLVHRGLGEIAVGLGFGPIMVLGAYFVQAERFSWEAGFASIPVAILISLILYVNEIPDRRGDAAAGKRTLPVRWSKGAVIAAYVVAATLTYLAIAGGALVGIIPRPTILALATIPLAVKVARGLWEHYDSPYTLMGVMGVNIQLHALTGGLLILGYLIAIWAD
ncbi:MAG TPA: prenyltransferase, partial [Actinomycetota bacterium]